MSSVDDARARVEEYLTAHRENHQPDDIAHEHYHDGMGHGVGMLYASDLRTLLDELRKQSWFMAGCWTRYPDGLHPGGRRHVPPHSGGL